MYYSIIHMRDCNFSLNSLENLCCHSVGGGAVGCTKNISTYSQLYYQCVIITKVDNKVENKIVLRGYNTQ